jgi:acyl-CoA synthetase (AMP-forming)/AMP-acid ligase II
MHMQDIVGTLISGASLIMLRPYGTLDISYLVKVLIEKQITYMQSVPSYLTLLCDNINTQYGDHFVNHLRSLCSGGKYLSIHCSCQREQCIFYFVGEALSAQLTRQVHNTMLSQSSSPTGCRFWNLYGPAETTLDSTYYLIKSTSDLNKIPLGLPLPNYRCLILDEFLQPVIVDQEGELFVGGVGVFAGYLGRQDLTENALVKIEGEIFYRTGDLVRLDHNGLLHYVGRKDHQVKLHGQRIELSEIERCLLNTSISTCVVIKWGDDHLIAYVQSHDINVEELREHCRSHLPSFMIPSMFIVVEQFPLNENGKLDRNKLPPPKFSSLTTTTVAESDLPHSQMEEWVHDLWCQILQHDGGHIPITASLFSVGGHSLLLIQLYHRYQLSFGFDHQTLTIGPFLRQATIAQHAQLLQTIQPIEKDLNRWPSLHMIQGNLCFETRICIPVVLY